MITALYFQKSAAKYRYELERITRSFSLPHKLDMLVDTQPLGDGYAEFYADDTVLSVTVCDGEKVTESESIPDNITADEAEKRLCVLLVADMVKLGHKPLPWGILTGVRPVKYIRYIYDSMGKAADRYITENLLVSEKKLRLAQQIIKIQQPILDTLDSRRISLYISVPFCPSRCSYCSFVSSAGESAVKLVGEYFELLLKELDIYADMIRRYRLTVDTIYIGGGTPTMLTDSMLSRLCEKLAQLDLSNLREFTAEAGRPDTITEAKLRALKDGGVRRISINPQTMSDSVLEAIGRRHSSAQVEAAFEIARRVGFDVINSDLIAGLPTDTPDSFEKSLYRLLSLDPENITVHTLSLKRSSALYRSFGDDIGKYAAVMTGCAADILGEHGYSPYYLYRQKNIADNLENTGYCKKGAESLYNIFIMEELQTILAAGCGASTKLCDGENITRVINYKYPFEYIGRFQLMNERKKDIENFFKRQFSLAK